MAGVSGLRITITLDANPGEAESLCPFCREPAEGSFLVAVRVQDDDETWGHLCPSCTNLLKEYGVTRLQENAGRQRDRLQSRADMLDTLARGHVHVDPNVHRALIGVPLDPRS